MSDITKISLFASLNNVLTLPVSPTNINIIKNNKIIRTDMLTAGEIIQLGGERLQEVSFSSFFPEFVDSYVNINKTGVALDSPETWVNHIKTLMKYQIICIITIPTILMRCYISGFQYQSIGGEGKDINYTMTLVEAKDVSIRSVNFGSFEQPISISTVSNLYMRQASTYTVQKGDTLAGIARKTHFTIANLKQLNDIVDSSITLTPGKILYVGRIRPYDEIDTSEILE